MKQRKFEGMRAWRLELGMTLEDVARKAGISSQMVRAVEVGGRKGSLMIRTKIADALGIPLRYLVPDAEAAELLGFARAIRKGESK